jgi:hypothetical protein
MRSILVAPAQFSACGRLALGLLLFAGDAVAPKSCPADDGVSPPQSQPAGQSGRVRTFDFDERPLGNFEEIPMYWERLAGPGLPSYSRGGFDDQRGRQAAPSFRFDLRGGSIGYEYRGDDLHLAPDADYILEGYIRAEGLEAAAAFIAAYRIGPDGERIAASECVSEVVRSVVSPADGGDPAQAHEPPWQRVEIPLTGDCPGARALRVQLWVLQDHVWMPPAEHAVDPIIRQDVEARVWFDDVSLRRVPRVRLRTSCTGGVVAPEQELSFLVSLDSATEAPLAANLTVRDAEGRVVFEHHADVAPLQTTPLSVRAPPLASDMYTLEFELRAQDEPLLRRALRFVVLSDDGPRSSRRADVGVDLGTLARGDAEGLLPLVRELGCGAVKMGLPIHADTANTSDFFPLLHELLRQLALAHIDATGVIIAPEEFGSPDPERSSTRQWISSDEDWSAHFAPILARFGGLMANWQLGFEHAEVETPQVWDERTIEQVRTRLDRIVTISELVVPRSVLDAPPATSSAIVEDGSAGVAGTAAGRANPAGRRSLRTIQSYWLPERIPTPSIPWQLLFIPRLREEEAAAGRAHPSEMWLSLEARARSEVAREAQGRELARRFILAKAANPDRVYLPAPIEHTSEAGSPAWQPTDDFLVARTLLRRLGGKRAIASMPLEHDGVGVLFSDGQRSCLAVWSWRDDVEVCSVPLYLGPDPTAVDVLGRPVPLEPEPLRSGRSVRRAARTGRITDEQAPPELPRTRVPLRASPLIIDDVRAALVLLHGGIRVEPTLIELHDHTHTPVLSIRNSFHATLVGSIRLDPPDDWTVAPSAFEFSLAPGETLRRELSIQFGRRQSAGERVVAFQIHLEAPESYALTFEVPFQIGLRDIAVEADAQWSGGDLLIEHRVRNLTEAPISFTSFCQIPGRARQEREFLSVPPGHVKTRVYRIPRARDAAGGVAHLGLQEIRGPRALEQLVEIPPD